jgi:hypothetical protein
MPKQMTEAAIERAMDKATRKFCQMCGEPATSWVRHIVITGRRLADKVLACGCDGQPIKTYLCNKCKVPIRRAG